MRPSCLALPGFPPRPGVPGPAVNPKEPTCLSVPGNSELTDTAGMGSALGAAHPVRGASVLTPRQELLGRQVCQDICPSLDYPSTHHQLFDGCSNNNLGSERDQKFNFNNVGALVEMSQKVNFLSVFIHSVMQY